MKIINTSGKRKTAIARATLREGKGWVRINSQLIDYWGTQFLRLRVNEPLILSGDLAKKVDIDVNVSGGGSNGQAEAIRLAIGRALAKYSPKLKKTLEKYDRLLLVADVRQKETRKPNTHSNARAKVQKSYR